jgi:hypothetical protein
MRICKGLTLIVDFVKNILGEFAHLARNDHIIVFQHQHLVHHDRQLHGLRYRVLASVEAAGPNDENRSAVRLLCFIKRNCETDNGKECDKKKYLI